MSCQRMIRPSGEGWAVFSSRAVEPAIGGSVVSSPSVRSDASLLVRPAHLVAGCTREQHAEDGDAAAVDADLGVAHFAGEPERAAVRGADPGPVLESAAADASKLVVVDVGAVGDEQDYGGPVDVELDGDIVRLEFGKEQV